MRFVIWFLAIVLLLIIQSAVLVPLHLVGVNLILILVVSLVLLSDLNTGLVLTVCSGLLLDFVSGSPDGLITISLFGTFLALYFIVNSLLSREPNQFILFTSVACGTIGFLVLFYIFNQILSFLQVANPQDFKYFFTVLMPTSLVFNLLFTYPVFQYYLWTQKITTRFYPQT